MELSKNIEAERIVLSNLLAGSNESDMEHCYARLKPDHFFDKNHKVIYRAITLLWMGGQPFDFISVSNFLKDKKSNISSKELSEIASFPIHSKIENVIDVIIDHFNRRRVFVLSAKAMELSETSFSESYNALKEGIDEIDNDVVQDSETSLKHTLGEFSNTLSETMKNGKNPDLIQSGYKMFDYVYGFYRKELFIAAARPSVGKTAWMVNVVNKLCEQGISVGIISLESSAKEIVTRLICVRAGIDSKLIKHGKISSSDRDGIIRESLVISNWPFYINDNSSLTERDIRSVAKKWKKQRGIEILFIDYLQYMRCSQDKGNRVQELGIISKEMKSVAKSLNIPVVMLCQMSRLIEQRGKDSRPVLSDLRDSGEIEQDADTVMFLHNPNIDNKEESQVIEMIFRKCRNGAVGTMDMIFNRTYTQFLEKMY